MDVLIHTGLTALAASFLISAIEYWYPLRFYRGVVALALSLAAMYFAWSYESATCVVVAMASSFVTLLILMWIDKPMPVSFRR